VRALTGGRGRACDWPFSNFHFWCRESDIVIASAGSTPNRNASSLLPAAIALAPPPTLGSLALRPGAACHSAPPAVRCLAIHAASRVATRPLPNTLLQLSSSNFSYSWACVDDAGFCSWLVVEHERNSTHWRYTSSESTPFARLVREQHPPLTTSATSFVAVE